MGKYNIIAIGGTGVRCLESLIHLCAVGLGPEELFILIVDSDASNGNINKIKEIITKYRKCYQILSPSRSIFKTKITFSEEKLTWSPADERESLSGYFKYDTLKSKKLGDICQLLYTQKELNLPCGKGFCGRPLIGAPFMTRIKDSLKDEESPWPEIINNIKQDLGNSNDARLFVFTSVFGATGASGFPVVARVLRDYKDDENKEPFQKNKNLYVGGALILPYFSFKPPKGKEKEGIFASPDDFLLETKVALKHYSSIRDLSPYNAVYLIGEKTLAIEEDGKERRFFKGGENQKNYAHYIELLAALSSLNFCNKKKEEIKRNLLQQYTVARAEENVIEWNDLPSTDFKKKLLVFTTLAFSYRVFYYPLLIDNKLDLINNRPYLIPWYIDHFDFLKSELSSDKDKDNLKAINEYLETCLEWLYEMSSSCHREFQLRLLKRDILKKSKKGKFKELDDKDFKSLSYSDESHSNFGYDKVWDRLCEIELSSGEEVPANAAGKFTYLLRKASREFCKENYRI